MLIGKGSVFFLFTVSPSEIQAGLNASATLPCNVTLPGPTEMSLIQVSWTSNGSSVASFSNSIPNTESGFSWNASLFHNGDFSLSILATSFNLQGLYECTVSYNSTMRHSSNVTFSILGAFTSFSARPDVNAWTCHQFVSFYDPLTPTALPHRPSFLLFSPPHVGRASAVADVGNREPSDVPSRWLLPSAHRFLLDQSWDWNPDSHQPSSRWTNSKRALHSHGQPDHLPVAWGPECDLWLQSVAQWPPPGTGIQHQCNLWVIQGSTAPEINLIW